MWCIDSEKRSTTTTSRCGPSPNAFMFGFSCHPLLLLLLPLSFRKVMCVVRKRILFARLVVVVVVGDDGGATWTGRSVQEEKRLAKKTDYHKKESRREDVHTDRILCWSGPSSSMLATQQEAQVFFFFPFFPRVLEKKLLGWKEKEKHIRVLGLFFGTPLSFFPFFLSPRAASASWRVIYNRWKGPQHRGGKLLMSFSILPLSLSCCGGRQSYVNQSGNKPP